MNTRFSKAISMLLALVMVFSMLGTTAFAATGYYACLSVADATVELDGTNPGTVTVKLAGAGAMDVYGIEGTWDTTETQGSGKLTLTSITSGLMTFTGMNYVDVPSGKVMWSDDTFSAPANVTNGADFLTATYAVAADTPAGTYTVRYCSEVLCASDFNPDTTKTYYSATITVTTNAGGGSGSGSAPESFYEMLKATNATVELDGTNPGTATVGVIGTYAMDVYGIEGTWDTAETEGSGKLTLNGIASDLMTFTGMNYVDVPSGKVMWSDDTFSAPANVTDGAKFLTATYTVAADTPAGTYTVRYCSEVLCASDFNPDTTKTYYTATITVTRPAGHTCAGEKQNGQSATCTVDGWNDYYSCTCGKYYTDAACTDEIADLAAWKTGAGKIAASHDYGTLVEEDPGVHTATELKNGMQAHYFCDTCDTYFDSNKSATTKEALTITVAHDYANEYGYKGEDGHANTCACGAKDTVVAHTPNIPAPTEEDDQICSACEYVIEVKTGHIHMNNLTKVPANTADCTNDGNIEYYTCSCGNWYADATAAVEITDKESVKIPAGHNYGTLVAAQAEVHTATELKAAVAAHYFCDACDAYFTEGKVATTLADLTSAAPTHDYANEYGYKAADGHANTCACGAKDTVVAHTPNIPAPTEEDDQICSACEYVIENKTGHIHANNLTKVPANTADCTNDGNIEYYTCSCDKWFADAAAATEITDKNSVKIPAAHNYGTLVAAQAEVHTATELKAAVAAHYFCDACDTYFTEGKVATTLADLTSAAPTHNYATEYGYKEADGHANTCACGAKDTVVAHTPDRAEATEDEAVKCSACEYVITPALGHQHQNHLTSVGANAADCENDGNIAYYTCSCGKWFADATASVEITDKNSVKIPGGHDYGTLVAAQAEVHTATELKAGVAAHYFCDACDTYFTEGKVATTLEALTGAVPAHNYANEFGYKAAEGHADTCACGAKDTVVAHTPDREEATEEDAILCADCGYEIAPVLPHTHRPGQEWKTDKKNHWNECACGEMMNKAAHADADGDVRCDTCDYDMTPSVTPETGDNSLALLISLFVLGCLGVVATVVCKKRFSVK